MKIAPGIYPTVIPDEILADPKRKAEINVYNTLAEQLGKRGYYIFYNCDWYDPSKDVRGSRDGEADFIVAHPELGYICLEVKGGDVYRDKSTRKWFVRKFSGDEAIQNPISQAKRSKHVVLRLLKESWGEELPFIRIKHGMILPNCGKPKAVERLGADMPLDLFAFFEDMHGLGGRVLQIFLGEPEGGNPTYVPIGDKGIRIIHDLFQRELNLPVSLESELDHYDRRLSSLTDEQEEILQIAEDHDRVLVLGGAGTGKTFLAQRKAFKLATEGRRTLFLVYNSPLARFLRANTPADLNLKIVSFHELCGWYCEQAGITFAPHEAVDEGAFFEIEAPKLLLNALDKREDLRFEALVVDEAQDIRPAWWEPIFLTLKDFSSSRIHVFKDDNQNLYGQDAAVEKLLGVKPLVLTKNVRNTLTIFDSTLPFYSGHTRKCMGPAGPLVRIVQKTRKELAEGVRAELRRLTTVEEISPSRIAVLSFSAVAKSVVGSEDLSEFEPVRADSDQSGSRLVHDSVWRFKGLERSVVILTDIEDFSDNTELLYVALSRARAMSIVFADPRIAARLQTRIMPQQR